ncbi:MAG: alkaline phosphatase family protein [Herpetosiphonaceae bacterium]|nr:alkaline phosphatase family protein [Herpetosiphonaceae bacterium]
MRQVLVFGIDAATLDLVEPWVAAGQLPTLQRLMQGGSYAPLRSTVPALSPPAWTSMITGQNPGKHGIYDFVHLLPGSYRLTSTRRDQTHFRTIFDLASEQGQSVLAMNIPLTYPPPTVNGSMVAGLGAPSQGRFAYPPKLRDELLGWGYRIDPVHEYVPGRDAEYIAELEQLTRIQADCFMRLLQREPWDLAMMVFRIVDEFQSFLWHHMDPSHPLHEPRQPFDSAILDAYQLMDRILAECLAAVPKDTTVLVVSDHGGGPLYKEVFLNVWLEQHGWLQRKQTPTLTASSTALMRRLGLTREKLAPKLDWPLAHALRRRIPQHLQHALVPEQGMTIANSIDWSHTRAFSFGNIGQIFVNLKGREPQGSVEPGAEYEQLIDDMTAALYELQDDGKPVVDRVFRANELYHGPYADTGADLNLIMRDMSYIAHGWRELAGDTMFAMPGTNESGTHRPTGLLIAYGPNIVAHERYPEVNITDVAPTILWLLGLPLPQDLDGRLMTELIHATALSGQPPEAIVTAALPITVPPDVGWENADEETEVLERLKNLGYVD